MSRRKPFDEELAEECDLPVVGAVCGYLRVLGYSPVAHPEGKFGPDIGVDIGQGKMSNYIFIEVQMRSKEYWKEDGTFKYSSIHVPERYLEGDTPKGKLIIVQVRPDLKRGVFIPGFECTEEDRLIEVPNKFVAEGEEFYDVPLANCYEISLDVRERKEKTEGG